MTCSVITHEDGCVGRITLNRPSAHHALNHKMTDAITHALMKWRRSDKIEFVLVDHRDGTSGFCVGNDAIFLAESARSIGQGARAYLQSASRMFHAIATFPKPFITIMDGATSGHGIGLSINGHYRIATERTSISFPETSYGSIPDGGATRFLSRLPSELGTWMALTGAPLTGKDVVAGQIATHFCPSEKLPRLKEALIQNGLSALADYSLDIDPYSIEYLAEMERFFPGDCMKTIRRRLGQGGSWALEQARKIDAKSPLSSKITLRQLRTGKYLDSVESALKIEYRILSRLIESRNFQEGVRAKYIDKDHCPLWRPFSLNRITTDMVGKYFSPLPSQELNLQRQAMVLAEHA